MPKINFNVPFINENGEPVRNIKYDQKKIKFAPNGQAMAQPVVDAEGFAVQEDISIKDMLVKILNSPYEGDEKLGFADRAKRGKLSRRLQTSSLANYSVADLSIIEELAAKQGSTTLLAQLDDLINGGEETDKAGAPKTEAPAAESQAAA